MTLKDQIEIVFIEKNTPLHINELADILIRKEIRTETGSELSSKISATLSEDLRKHKQKSRFAKVKGKNGIPRKGFYRLKKKRSLSNQPTIPDISPKLNKSIPEIDRNYLGKAGEFAVLSELLFEEYNANIMSVDEGIDLVASKNNKYFYIQVKTTQIRNHRISISGIKTKRFRELAEHKAFYIFVLRHYKGSSRRNDFIVIRSSDIEEWLETGFVNSSSGNINITINIEGNDLFLIKKGEKEKITYHLNKFELIK